MKSRRITAFVMGLITIKLKMGLGVTILGSKDSTKQGLFWICLKSWLKITKIWTAEPTVIPKATLLIVITAITCSIPSIAFFLIKFKTYFKGLTYEVSIMPSLWTFVVA